MSTRSIRLWHLLILMIPTAIVCFFVSVAQQAMVYTNRSNCYNNLFYNAIQLVKYRDGYGHYPPAVFTGEGRKPVHSWRVLTYNLGGNDLASDYEYNLGEPWDSPGNLKAAAAPSWLVCRNNQSDPRRYTNYVAVINRGVSTLQRADAIPRGSPEAARQVLLIEYPNSDILWTEPRDLDADDLGKLDEGNDLWGIGVVFADAKVRRVSLAELRKLFGR